MLKIVRTPPPNAVTEFPIEGHTIRALDVICRFLYLDTATTVVTLNTVDNRSTEIFRTPLTRIKNIIWVLVLLCSYLLLILLVDSGNVVVMFSLSDSCKNELISSNCMEFEIMCYSRGCIPSILRLKYVFLYISQWKWFDTETGYF